MIINATDLYSAPKKIYSLVDEIQFALKSAILPDINLTPDTHTRSQIPLLGDVLDTISQSASPIDDIANCTKADMEDIGTLLLLTAAAGTLPVGADCLDTYTVTEKTYPVCWWRDLYDGANQHKTPLRFSTRPTSGCGRLTLSAGYPGSKAIDLWFSGPYSPNSHDTLPHERLVTILMGTFLLAQADHRAGVFQTVVPPYSLNLPTYRSRSSNAAPRLVPSVSMARCATPYETPYRLAVQ